MSAPQRAIGVGLLYLLTIGTGIWLSNSGRPLSTLFITVHKLIALATVVLTSMPFWRLLRHVQTNVLLLGLMIASAALFVISARLLRIFPPASFKFLLTKATLALG